MIQGAQKKIGDTVQAIPAFIQELWVSQALRDTGKVFVATSFGVGISFGGSLIVQRVVDVESLGILASFNNLLGLASGVIIGSVITTIVRYLGKYIDHNTSIAKVLIHKALWLQLLVGLAAITLFYLLGPFISVEIFHKPALTPYIQFAGVSTFAGILISFYQSIFQSQQRFSLYSTIIISLALINTGGTILLAVTHLLTPWSVIILGVIANLALIAIAITMYRRSTLSRSPSTDLSPHLYSEILHFSKWILVMIVCTTIFMRVDIFMLTAMVSLKDVAMYSFAYGIYSTFLIVVSAVNTIVLPRIARLVTPEEFSFASRRILQLSTILGLAIIPFFFLIPPLVHLVFSSKFNESLPVFFILAVSLVFSIALNPTVNFLMVLNQQKFLAKMSVVSLMLHVLGNLLVIPRYGIIGAALVTTLSFMLSNIVLFIRARNELARQQRLSESQV